MCKVVTRVDAPAGSGVGVGCVADAVGDEVVEVGVVGVEVHAEAEGVG